MPSKTSTLAIYLVGGNVLRLKVNTWSLKKSNGYNELTEFTWDLATKGTQLGYIKLSDVQAIVDEG